VLGGQLVWISWPSSDKPAAAAAADGGSRKHAASASCLSATVTLAILTRALFGWRGKRGKRGKSIYFLPQTSKHEVKLVEVNVLPLLFPLPLFRCQMGVK